MSKNVVFFSLFTCLFLCLLINLPLKSLVELSTKILISISVKVPTLIFLLPANSLLKRNFLMVILVHMSDLA